jgi:hypothetical protein
MSQEDQRNTLIVEMVGHSNQPVQHYQSLNDADLAGAAAVMVFLRTARIRTDAELKTISDDDQRNIMIVEINGNTNLGSFLQSLSNIDLVLLGLGKLLPGGLSPSSFIRGVLLAGGFRTHHQLIAMSAEDQRNTLIVEMVAHSNQPVGDYQGLNDFQLAGAGAVMVFLRGAGIRDDTQLKTISADDQRNIMIVEIDGQTHLGSKLQSLISMDLVRLGLGVDPGEVFTPVLPPISEGDNRQAGEGDDRPEKENPELGDPHGNLEAGCFIGDTPVLMADGLTKNIDAIAVGDQVMARDENTGATAVGAVARIFRHHVAETLLLRMEGGEMIETTAAHRFAAEEQGFVSAGQLRPGDRLSTHDDQGSEVVSTGTRSAEVTVYNLSIDRFHTFFIGGAGLWVHNVKKADPHEPEDEIPKP